MKRKRILWAGNNIAGHYQFLHDEFCRIGIKSHITHVSHKFNYSQSYKEKSKIIKIYLYITKQRQSSSRLNRYLSRILLNIYFFIIFLPWIALNIDVIFYCVGKTLSEFDLLELIIIKFLRKKIVFTFHGSDVRPPYISAPSFMSNQPNKSTLLYLNKTTKSILKIVKRAEIFADEILVSPSASAFFKRKVVNISLLGNPINEKNITLKNSFKVSSKITKTIKILHSPSHASTKGTYEIKKMIDKLKLMGYSIDYSVIKNKSNKTVLKALTKTDIVIDSLWNESPAGTFPAEAAFCGKPVLIGSYFASSKYSVYTDNIHIPPYCFVTPDKFFNELTKLVSDYSYRNKKGRELLNYMKKYKTLNSIANEYLKLADSKLKKEFYYFPKKVCYPYGYGAPQERIREFVKEYIKVYGREGLALNNNPILESNLLDRIG